MSRHHMQHLLLNVLALVVGALLFYGWRWIGAVWRLTARRMRSEAAQTWAIVLLGVVGYAISATSQGV